MDTEKVGKWIKISGAVFTLGCLLTLIIFSFSDCSKKPLSPAEEKRFQEIQQR